MSKKDIAIGFAIGFGIGTIIGLLYAPESGEETRQLLKEKTEGVMNKLIFNLKWLIMSPRERYLYFWNRGGSLRELRQESASFEPDQPSDVTAQAND
jgi:gas vesicle protein